MNVTQSAYPLPNRAEMRAYLDQMKSKGDANSIVRDADRCLEQFTSQTGDGLVQELQEARNSTSLRTTAGVLAGVVVAGIGLYTGHAVAGVAGGVAVAGVSLVLGARRQSQLSNFGLAMGAVNILQVAEGKFDAQPHQQEAPHVQAEPMPKRPKPESRPKMDTLLDLQPNGSYVVYERPIPEPPKGPETVTVIDMKQGPDGVFVQDRIYQAYVVNG